MSQIIFRTLYEAAFSRWGKGGKAGYVPILPWFDGLNHSLFFECKLWKQFKKGNQLFI